MKAKTCKHEGCNNPAWSKGFCQWHKPKSEVKRTPKSPIKKISDKRKKQRAAYSILRKQFLKDNPKCAVFPNLDSVEIHHVNHTEGERLNDTKYWLAVSRIGHNKIHNFPEWSYEKGFLIKG